MPRLSADVVRLAFWNALRDLQAESSLVPAQVPEFDEPSGGIAGVVPEVFYQKLADRLSLHQAWDEE